MPAQAHCLAHCMNHLLTLERTHTDSLLTLGPPALNCGWGEGGGAPAATEPNLWPDVTPAGGKQKNPTFYIIKYVNRGSSNQSASLAYEKILYISASVLVRGFLSASPNPSSNKYIFFRIGDARNSRNLRPPAAHSVMWVRMKQVAPFWLVLLEFVGFSLVKHSCNSLSWLVHNWMWAIGFLDVWLFIVHTVSTNKRRFDWRFPEFLQRHH